MRLYNLKILSAHCPCTGFIVEEEASQFPDPDGCSHASPAIMDSFSIIISQNQFIHKLLLVLIIYHSNQKINYHRQLNLDYLSYLSVYLSIVVYDISERLE